ncbi:LamG domain-containing protein [Lentzea aerocolonigenes]|uniref:LamG domain-containing protein n=1 Tax=Lentzea aerocolonigenes TaxID=68170 RepID=UPI00068E0DF1|nr:LamG domain-containing protein [Lentzea aerocolonigenes]MCP2249588.1 Concanavalin A-like lectin/glucanases superfamily protein [Lentzea aerocolonigenes]
MAATAVVVTASAPQAPPVAVPITEAPDTGSALVAARAQGTEVEAISMRTSTREVFAQPNGQLKALLSAVPQRIQRDGKWLPIETALEPGSDGITPKATETGLTFSRGGTEEPLVRLRKDGKSFALTWPGTLPAPALDGPNATYTEVLPGVDLRMIARNDGYQQLIIVKNREAARHVERVRLGVKTDGLELKPAENGAFTMVDAAGAKVFEVPTSLMWDSKKQENPDAPRTDQQPVGVEIAADALTLVPHQGMLADSATVYPVYIDPAPHVGVNDGWTTVYDDGTNAMREGKHWNGYDTEAEKPEYWWIGVSPTARSGRAYGWNLKTRTYFQYNTSFLGSKDISSARLDVEVVHSPTCNVEHNHRLYQSRWDVDWNTNWNNQPADWGVISEISVPSVYSNCSGHKALSFTSPNFPAQIDKTGNSTFSIRAADEGNQDYWRKFDPGKTKLVIYYNGTPNTPEEPSTDLNLQACANCAGMPWVGDSTIQLRAKLSDPDGDQVNGIWDVYDDVVPGDPAKQNKRVFTSGPHGSGTTAAKDVPLSGVADDRLITWFVAASDGDKKGGYVIGPKQFRIDRTAPVNQPDVSSLAYPDDNRWHGGTTVPGAFTFTAKDADVDRFDYGWDDAMTNSVVANGLGGKATVTLTPPGDGPRDLFVRSRDKAGNPGPKRVHHIYVRAGSGAISQYTLDGNVNDSAYLGDRHGTTHGNVSYVSGPLGSALNLDGSGGHITAPTAVRTDASFSVSAWVKVDAVDGSWGTAVSQVGNETCGFCLRYEGGSRRWVFLMPHKDSITDNQVVFVRSTEEPTAGAWTHLTGVYDAGNSQLKLYVNGVLQGTSPGSPTPWNAASELRIGQSKAGSVSDTWWRGGIDEVRVYDRPLTDAEVRGEVRRDNVQAGHWRFEEDLATVARNSVTNGESAMLSGGVSFFEQRPQPKNHALRFDGTGQVRTTGPVVRTDKSFSVSGYVTLADTNGTMTVLSQDGPDSSGFVLQQKDGRWQFGMTEGNGSTAWNVLAQTAPGTAVANTPTHLAAVFDSVTKKASLYVNGGTPAESAAATKPFWDSAGAFVMGNDQQGAALRGDLDDVRVHSRALAADEVADIVKLDADPVRQWRLDGDGLDTSGYNGTASLGDQVSWGSGQSDNSDPKDLSLRISGVPGASLYASHVLDTSRNFSVSAWARLDKLVDGQSPTVLSQDGTTTSAFQLQATPDGHWAFAMFQTDQAGGGARHDRAIGAVAQLGVWTHLVGTYDAARDVMTLYVNGVEAATVAHPDAWNHPTGQFRIGRGLWDSKQADYFPGAIDDVEVHTRVLFADEIRDKAGRDLSLVHKWQFDEGTGTNAADSVGGKAGTLTNAAFGVGRLGNAATFNGTNAEVSTGAVVRTDQNFTVSAWVKMPEPCSANCKRVAVSQEGEHNSKFRLGFLKDRDHLGNWVFEMTEDDTDATKVTVAAVSAEVEDFTEWVHLVGVYDRAAKQVLLYVQGNRVGDGVVNSVWQANGGLQIGRAKLRSAPAERWAGSIDDVRFYTGALDNEGVFGLFRSYPEKDQPAATLPAADAGHWKLNDGSGTTAVDSSGRNNTMTFTGTAPTWIGGRNGAGVSLDGSTASAETAGPVIEDTSRSFTASAWVYAQAGVTGRRAVLAQDGTRMSAFSLSYDGDSGKWAVVQSSKDEDGAPSAVLLSTELAKTDRWTHLAVVHDAASKQLRLYVNGVLSAVNVGVVMWKADGPFVIGRNKVNGVKGSWFYRGIDDVRVFGSALTAGEVGKVHDDAPFNDSGLWKFDENSGNDSTWRNNTATTSGNASYVPGVIGNALKLDGSASAAAQWHGVNTRDSFTVEAWARLERDDKTYTVLGQNGTSVSTFVLQYRPESKRWVFAAPVQDSDQAPLVKAQSAEPAVTWRWTHLAGVYDHVAGQLRLYVDGKLAGSESARLWPSDGGMTIGKGRWQGKDADLFAGLVDEVRAVEGAVTEAKILEHASRPLPAAGQLGRYVSINGTGEHYTGLTSVPPLPNYRYEGVAGQPVSPTEPNTQRLYSCKSGTDHFSSTAADCEGATLIGETGAVYSVKPVNIPTVELNLCVVNADRFTSLASDCEGQTKVKRLGYLRAYAPLVRYLTTQFPWDHWSTTQGVLPGYKSEGVLGYLAMTGEPGTTTLWVCREGTDTFSSLDSTCGGKQKIGSAGNIWTTAPADKPSKELFRCRANGVGNRFDSLSCEGHPVEQSLGFVLVSPPATAATF